VGCFASFAGGLHGQAPDGPPQPRPQPEFPPIQEVTKGYEARRGFITLHVDMKKHRVLGEIPGNLLGKPFLLAVSIAGGGYYTGWQWDDRMVLWERLDRKLVLVEPEIRYKAQGTLAEVVKRTYRDRVITSVPILSEGQGGACVVDMSDLLATRSFLFAGSLGRGIDPSLTKVAKAKAFQKNVELEFDLVRGGGEGGGGRGGRQGVVGGSGRIGVHYSISELAPAAGYRPRAADDRIGYFLTAYKDFSKDPRDDTSFVRHINRWRLEKADPTLELSPPKDPITFYVEKTVPIRFRRYVHEGILEWNEAFEKIGILGALVVRQQTDTEFNDLDPEDVRYNFFRWITSESSFAMGPSRVHPETGEILDADIIFDDAMIRTWLGEYSKFLAEGPAKEFHPALRRYLEEHPERHPLRRWSLRSPALAPHPETLDVVLPPGVEPPEDYGMGAPGLMPVPAALRRQGQCDFGHGVRHEVNMGLVALEILEGLPPQPGSKGPDKGKDAWPEEFMGQVVKEVVMHEVGHTLGLRHNFKASTWLGIDEINSPERPPEALTGSVMDYNPTNITPRGKPQGYWNTRTLGPYDFWAIEYGYTLKDDPKELARIAGRVAEKGLSYATDEDTWSSDPYVNRFDMGSDPLEFSRRQVELVSQLLQDLVEKFVKPGQGYQRARDAFDMFLFTHGRSVRRAARFIGGHSIYRDHKGDPGERPPVEPVPAEKQREALDFVCEQVLSANSLKFPPALFKYLAVGRWSHWGSSDENEDPEYPIHDRILQVQLWAIFDILNPRTLTLVADAEARLAPETDAVTIPEILAKLTEVIWSEVKSVPPTGDFTNRSPYITTLRRNLQHEYLGQLIDLALEGDSGGSPQSARTQAWYRLDKLRQDIAGAIAKFSATQPKLDDYTRAHLEESFQRITKALDASYSRSSASSGGGGGYIIIGQPPGEAR
jgi:hypothetical protein